MDFSAAKQFELTDVMAMMAPALARVFAPFTGRQIGAPGTPNNQFFMVVSTG